MNELFDQKVLDFLSNLEEESFYSYTQNPCEKTKDIHERAKKKSQRVNVLPLALCTHFSEVCVLYFGRYK